MRFTPGRHAPYAAHVPPTPPHFTHSLSLPFPLHSLPHLVVQAVNLVEHEDEIYARPARTWFQTAKQKQELAERAKAAAAGALGG